MELAGQLAHSGVKVNITAVLTLDQVRAAADALTGGSPGIISIFAGRIADTGRDPVPTVAAAVDLVSAYSNIELIWASPRELLNIFQANDAVVTSLLFRKPSWRSSKPLEKIWMSFPWKPWRCSITTRRGPAISCNPDEVRPGCLATGAGNPY